jgi:hypothetical protein
MAAIVQRALFGWKGPPLFTFVKRLESFTIFLRAPAAPALACNMRRRLKQSRSIEADTHNGRFAEPEVFCIRAVPWLFP